MRKVICHIVGLDEIHKKKIIKQLVPKIQIIDLDSMQQVVYNHKDLLRQKIIWSQLSKDILVKNRQKKLIGSKRMKAEGINEEIKELISKRNIVRKNIHTLWKKKMDQGGGKTACGDLDWNFARQKFGQ